MYKNTIKHPTIYQVRQELDYCEKNIDENLKEKDFLNHCNFTNQYYKRPFLKNKVIKLNAIF